MAGVDEKWLGGDGMLLKLELKLLLLYFFFFPVHKWTPPPRLPVGARPSPPPATVHVLPRGSERKMRAKRGCEIERKKICLRGCERDFHNLGEGENATPATSDSPRQEKTLRFSSLQHLNTFTSFTELGVRNREETGDGDKQWGGHSRAPLSGGSSPPSVPTYPVGWPTRPRSPCCVVPAAVRDRACREGRGGKSLPSGTVGSAWSETGAWGVMCPSASVTRSLCQGWHSIHRGIACFSLLDNDGLCFFLRLFFYCFHELLSVFNGPMIDLVRILQVSW